MKLLPALKLALAQGPVCLVEVLNARGSVPRAPGTWMAVPALGAGVEGLIGTIGGGHLEWQAIQRARQFLAGDRAQPQLQRMALGPSLGQCCGGALELRYTQLQGTDLACLARQAQQDCMPVAVFGAGHVGQALVRLLLDLPCRLHWLDSRAEPPPLAAPVAAVCTQVAPLQDGVLDLPAQSRVVVLSFSHAEDLEVIAACLRRQRASQDLAWIGLIGSASKWASFSHRLQQRGFSAEEIDLVHCPIGVAGVSGKEPEVIALAIAAQLLQTRAEGGAGRGAQRRRRGSPAQLVRA